MTATLNVPDTDAVDAWLEGYLYAGCRETGHAFPKGQRDWQVDGSGTSVIYRKERQCRDCPTVRVDRVNSRFEQLPPRYLYTDDYRAEPGLVVHRIDVRRFEIKQMIATEAKAARAARSRKRATEPTPARRVKPQRAKVTR